MLAVDDVVAIAVDDDGTYSFELCCLSFCLGGFGTELGSSRLTICDCLVRSVAARCSMRVCRSASTCVADAEGSSLATEPLPCSVSYARRSAFMAVVFLAPVGPTNTSTTGPDNAIAVNALLLEQ